MLRAAPIALVTFVVSVVSGCSGDDTNSAPVDGGADASALQDATMTSGDGASGDGAGTQEGGGETDGPIATTDGGDGGHVFIDAGPCSHSACIPGAALSATCGSCTQTMCTQDDDYYCCGTSWDLSCAERAHALCATECTSDPAATDGGVAQLGGSSHVMAQITSRDGAVCAVSVEGDVWCWGFDDILGDGSEQAVPFPRKIVGLPPTQAVSMAGSAICALGVDGGVRCWGRSPAGSPGTPIVTPPTAPILTNASGIAGDRILGTTGSSFMCAVISGTLECWGTVASTLGPGVGDPTAVPATVNLGIVAVPNRTVTQVSAGGEDTCVLVGDAGTPICWGSNATGMIGHNAFGGPSPEIATITCLPASDADGGPDDCANAINGIAKVAIGQSSTCLLDGAGTVRCLGDNTNGQLGIGTSGGMFPYPQAIAGLTASDVALGATHACAAPLDPTSPVVCWGSGANDQIGSAISDGGVAASPVAVAGLSGVTQLTASSGETCALKSDGTVWCWGTNADGQLGSGSSVASSAIPAKVSFLSFP